MTYNYDRPHYGPDGKYRYLDIFIEEHHSLQDDQYMQMEARKVVKRARWGRPLYKGPTLYGRWRGVLYNLGMDNH